MKVDAQSAYDAVGQTKLESKQRYGLVQVSSLHERMCNACLETQSQ